MAATSTLYPTTVASTTGTTWTTTGNATGSTTGTTSAAWAVFTNATNGGAGGTGTINLSGYAAQPAVTSGNTIDSVVLSLRGNVSATARWTAGSCTAQLFAGTTAIGSPVAIGALSTSTSNTWTITFTGANAPTYAQLSDLRVRVTAVHTSTTSSTFNVDTAGLVVNHSVPAAKADTLVGFSANTWTGLGTGRRIVGDTLELDYTVANSTVVHSANAYDLTGSSVTVQVARIAASGNETWVGFGDNNASRSAGNALWLIASDFTLYCREIVGGSQGDVQVPWDATEMAWFRLREAGGTVYWETAPAQAGPWTVRRSKAAAWTPSAHYVRFMGWNYSADQAGFVTLSNLNQAGSTPATGAATGTTTATGTAAGARVAKATAVGSATFTGTASGKRTPKATATGTATFTGTAAGKRPARAATSGTVTATGAATGSAPAVVPKTGTATGTTTATGTAAGRRIPKATAAGTVTTTGSAVGRRIPKATSSGTVTTTATAAGKRTAKATAAGTVTATGSAVGHRTAKATAASAVTTTGSAVGKRTARAAATGTVTTTGTAVGSNASAGDGTTPADVLDIGTQNHFDLQMARSGDPSWTEVTQAQIAAGYEEDPYFTTVRGGTAVQFSVPLDAPLVGSSTTPRSELREVQANGSDAAYNINVGVHEFHGRSRIMSATPDIVVAQLHNGDADRIAIRTQLVTGTLRLRARVNGSSIPTQLAGPYVVGDEFEWKIRVDNGAVSIFYNDMVTPVYTAAAGILAPTAGVTTWYFKAGSYAQATGSGTSSAVTELRDLQVSHAAPGAIPTGTASGSTTATGSATGKRTPKASLTGLVTITGTAVGTAPIPGQKTGTATGSVTVTGTAAGKRFPRALAIGTTTVTGYAFGHDPTAPPADSPAERTHTVQADRRIWATEPDPRITTVQLDQRTIAHTDMRTHTVTADRRTHTVGADPRTHNAGDKRTTATQADPRTLVLT